MNASLQDYLSSLRLGEPQTHRNIVVFPMIGTNNGDSRWLTLGEAIERQLLVVTEVSRSGSVPELIVINRTDRPVLLLDGEELIGARQNRVLNTTILLKEKSETIVPVSCTEQGRWSYVSAAFAEAKLVMASKMRAQKMRSVSESLAAAAGYKSDQGEVWEEIAALHAKAGINSPTSAMHDVFKARERELEECLCRFAPVWVESHHGSLSREHRLRTEKEFHTERDAVLVATNTLEVGVDIGDVDVVALVGAPPDTTSLLQRIGRGGRRSGLTRLLPLTRNRVEAAALASQLINAAAGRLETKHRFRRWDIFPQQVISYIRQNQGQGRSHLSLVELATEVWRQEGTGKIAATHLEAWRSDGRLQEMRGRLHLGTEWQKFDAEEDQEKTCHSNIRSSPAGVAVRNEVTGEIIGHISRPAEGGTMTIGGRQNRVVRQEAEIVVTPVTNEGYDETEDTPKYAGRRRRIAETFTAHVREGCGLGKSQAPHEFAGEVKR